MVTPVSLPGCTNIAKHFYLEREDKLVDGKLHDAKPPFERKCGTVDTHGLLRMIFVCYDCAWKSGLFFF